MRQIHSDAYGALELEESQIYSFEKGILGIPDTHSYALLPMADTPFFILHALEEQISFVLLPAHDAIREYSFQIDEDIIDSLMLNSPEDAAVMLIVNIQQEELFVNLMAPVLLSPLSMKGCQYVIKDQELSMRYPLLTKGEK
ncbi:Flagellar assembly factor FliW [compost metagenome]